MDPAANTKHLDSLIAAHRNLRNRSRKLALIHPLPKFIDFWLPSTTLMQVKVSETSAHAL
jgi:hypothetical protein